MSYHVLLQIRATATGVQDDNLIEVQHIDELDAGVAENVAELICARQYTSINHIVN